MNPSHAVVWPYLGLLCNALAWGVSWWPLRELQAMGLHPVWATVVFFAVSALIVSITHPQAWRVVLSRPALWVLALAAGATNAAFNWAVGIGDVVRVVLLFYLMPLWAVGLAWGLMGERITAGAALRIVLALAGAFWILQPAEGGWPRFGGLADVLGLLGGFGFALTNVMLRREAQTPAMARALAMFVGGTVFPLVLGGVLWSAGQIPAWPAWAWTWVWAALAVALFFFGANLALQYGASRLPVNTTSVVMLTEILFAAVSAVWWGDAVLDARIVWGGACIVLAAVLATRERPA